MSQIKTASLDEIKAMVTSGEVKPPVDDAPECDLPEDFWDKATVQSPLKTPADVKAHFQRMMDQE
jgi:hypothetical protein